MAEIALAMIVKNGARSIERALTSVAPHVDRMLVLDTGSTDDTVDIARRCGAQVEHFAWVDDFSAARNAALDAADADWNLILDADEWLVAGGESLDQLRHDDRRYVGVVRREETEQRDGSDLSYSGTLVRVLPRGIRYEFSIHEQPVHDLRGWFSPLVLRHDGYAAEDLILKEGRNQALLEAEVAARPGHPYLSFKLAQEWRKRGRAVEAAGLFATAYAGCPTGAPWRHAAVLGYLGCLGDAGRFEDALNLADAEMAAWSHSPDFFFVLGNLFLDYGVAHPERAAALLPMIEDAYLRCLEIGDQPQLENSLLGHGSFLAAKNLGALYESVGAQAEAAAWAAREVEMRIAAGVPSA